MLRLQRIALAVATPVALLLAAPPAFAADAAGVTFESSDDGTYSFYAQVTRDMKPDVLNIGVSCDETKPGTRSDIRQRLQQKYADLKALVGTNGNVRRNGGFTIYGGYVDPGMPAQEPSYSGNASFLVRNLKPENAEKTMDGIEELGCMGTWDARVLYVEKAANEEYANLMEQILSQKAFVEKVIGQKLTLVSNVSLSGSADTGGYYGGMGGGAYSNTTFDPETGLSPTIISLSVTFVAAQRNGK